MCLRELREARNMTQKEVGEELGLQQSTICQWETGVNRPLRKFRPRLAQLLGCTEEALERALRETEEGLC